MFDPLSTVKPRAICVLGMHRSGTSAITRGIVALGARTGEDLIPAALDNPSGFWEDREFVAFNDALLEMLGQSYDSLAYFSKDVDRRLTDKMEQAMRLVSRKVSLYVPWVVKDPRTCRLLPFWKAVFLQLGIDVGYVIAVRNPLSVAQSLQSRNQFPMAKSLLLWLEHYLAAVSDTHDVRRIFVEYEGVLKDPPGELRRLSDALGLAMAEDSDAEIGLFARSFLSTELSHANYSQDGLKARRDMPASVIEAYALLRAQCERLERGPDENFVVRWQRLASAFEENAAFVNFLQERDRAGLFQAIEFRQLQERFVIRDKEAARAGQAFVERDRALGELERAIDLLSAAVGEEADSGADSYRKDDEARDPPGLCAPLRLGDPVRTTEEPLDIPDYSHMSAEELAVRLNRTLLELDRAIAPLLRAIDKYTSQSGSLKRVLGDRLEVEDLNLRLRNGSARLKVLSEEGVLASEELAKKCDEKGLTAFLRKAFVLPLAGGWRRSSPLATYLWRRLPISTSFKHALRDRLFGRLPFLFRRTAAYRRWREFAALRGSGAWHTVTAADDSLGAMSRDSDFMPCLATQPPPVGAARLIAFYLPQFHEIPENNAWWGKGFTEWTNVIPAKPYFEGHYQPHLPGEMGCYDLLDPKVQHRQVELARLYGISGFCFYFYWFAGKRLLETPLLNYLGDPSLDLPFCLCWANENWSRRWDGLDSEILIAQHHTPEDDIAFIRHVARYIRDPRYIRIDGKPLLVVYRPSLLPSPKDTAKRWRDWCKENGIGSIYLAYTQSFESVDPAGYGFDAAIEFPPNNSSPPDMTTTVDPLNSDFAGIVYDWRVFVQRSRNYQPPGYRLFRSVCCSWDNTARRKNKGTIFLNSTPEAYREWLSNAIADSCRRFRSSEERFVFINAWNEWAEGAHLEPDARYGYAWLQATRDAVADERTFRHVGSRKMLVVTHDAFPHGAQYLALNITRQLATSLCCEVEVICLGGGPLKVEFQRYARFHDLESVDPRGARAKAVAEDLQRRGFRSAIVNTVVSGALLPVLKQAGMRCVSLIHELGGVINAGALQERARQVALYADLIVFAAGDVRDSFCATVKVHPAKLVLRPQGLYKRNTCTREARARARKALRDELALPQEAKIVVGVGYADHRKGVDYFADIASDVRDIDPLVHFVWVGHWEASMQHAMDELKKRRPSLFENLHFIGRREDTFSYYAGADIFALTSREDPFPSVVLEAMDMGLPIVAFAGSGGSNALIDEGVGVNVPMGDTAEFARVTTDIMDDRKKHRDMGQRGRQLIEERFSFRVYLFDLLGFAGLEVRKVSVIVPSYNYERYLPERIASIVRQTYPIYEIIFLDDASMDASVALATRLLADAGIEHHVKVNAVNSRSVFAQWRQGVEVARGNIVWIAEADDLSAPSFLDEVIKGFDDPEVVLSYCESMQIDEEGRVLAQSYHDYVADVDGGHWLSHYISDGSEEIRNYLAVKNTIPNVSAVLMRRQQLVNVLSENFSDISHYRVAGDWKIYIHLIAGSRLAYFPQPLNRHRRHESSVTLRSFDAAQIAEIRDIQQWCAREYGSDGEVRRKAKEYLDRLQSHLEIQRASR